MKRLAAWMLSLLALAACGYLFYSPKPLINAPSQPFRQEVYVWQRAWNADLQSALHAHGGDFHRVVVLATQITWEKPPDSPLAAKVFHVPVDWPALRASARDIGLAIRIGTFVKGQPFTGKSAEILESAVKATLASAHNGGAHLSEIQLDFDAADSLRWFPRSPSPAK